MPVRLWTTRLEDRAGNALDPVPTGLATVLPVPKVALTGDRTGPATDRTGPAVVRTILGCCSAPRRPLTPRRAMPPVEWLGNTGAIGQEISQYHFV